MNTKESSALVFFLRGSKFFMMYSIKTTPFSTPLEPILLEYAKTGLAPGSKGIELI